ncbi:MAG: RNA 2',3'-cyclic phosphodiesterase [Candidatus Omnitrophota bacterium]
MRTFIAIDISDEVKKELSRLLGELKTVGADIKWVQPENIHLTLKFLGDTEDNRIEQIKKVLNEISKGLDSFKLSLFKLGCFPSIDYPRVIWVGIDKGCSQAEQISADIEEKLEVLGFLKETRPFTSHLTLGRVKSGKNKKELKEKILSLEPLSKSCAAKGITLFQSELTTRGPIYTPIHLAKFKNI